MTLSLLLSSFLQFITIYEKSLLRVIVLIDNTKDIQLSLGRIGLVLKILSKFNGFYNIYKTI